MAEEPANQMVVTTETKGRDPGAAGVVGEANPMRYLYDSYIRLKQHSKGSKV